MQVVILGASGGVGVHLVKEGVERGHSVTAVVRDTTRFDAPRGVRVVKGNVLDPAFVMEALRGAAWVMSALGIKRNNPANPWSALASSSDFSSASAHHVARAMAAHQIGRVVAISAAGVAESAARMNAPMRFLVATSNVGIAYRDLAVMEQVYARAGREHGLDWMCVRPTRLTGGTRSSNVKVTQTFPAMAAISRADVAVFMWNALEQQKTFVDRLPTITG